MILLVFFFVLMIRRPPRSTRTDNTLSLHDALPIYLGIESRVVERHDGGGARGGFGPDQRRAVGAIGGIGHRQDRSEEHTSELQSLMRISYAVFCLKKKKKEDSYNMKGLLY